MGVKVPGTKYSIWCELDIRGTNGTKREKYSGVNVPYDLLFFPSFTDYNSSLVVAYSVQGA